MVALELQVAVTNAYLHDRFQPQCLCCKSILRSCLLTEKIVQVESDVDRGITVDCVPSCRWRGIGHLSFPMNRNTRSFGGSGREFRERPTLRYTLDYRLTTPGPEYPRETESLQQNVMHQTRKRGRLPYAKYFNLWVQCFDYGRLQHYYACKRIQQTQWLPPSLGFVPLSLTAIYSNFKSIFHESGLPLRTFYPSTVPHVKYWSQRHRLFCLFDCGISVDEESWYSITPEKIAHHQAGRCFHRLCSTEGHYSPGPQSTPRAQRHRKQFTVWDMFCGVGGNAIAFSRRTGFHVTAFDTNSYRLELALRNSIVYGVERYVDFVCKDSVAVIGSSPVVHERLGQGTFFPDLVFLSPPWGGPTYIQEDALDIRNTFVSEWCILDLILGALRITPNVAAFLPKNTNLEPLVSAMSHSGLKGPHFEVEKNYLNGKFKAVTVYFGDLACDLL